MTLNIVSNITANLSELGINVYDVAGQTTNILIETKTIGYLEGFVMAFCIYICAIIFHEIGHYFVLRRFSPMTEVKIFFKGFLPYIQTGVQVDYDILSKQDKINVYAMGIIIGLIPILFAGIATSLYLFLIGPYIVGCLGDFEKIWRNMKHDTTTND